MVKYDQEARSYKIKELSVTTETKLEGTQCVNKDVNINDYLPLSQIGAIELKIEEPVL